MTTASIGVLCTLGTIYRGTRARLVRCSPRAWPPADHVVQNRVIFPGAGYLEMARAAAAEQRSETPDSSTPNDAFAARATQVDGATGGSAARPAHALASRDAPQRPDDGSTSGSQVSASRSHARDIAHRGAAHELDVLQPGEAMSGASRRSMPMSGASRRSMPMSGASRRSMPMSSASRRSMPNELSGFRPPPPMSGASRRPMPNELTIFRSTAAHFYSLLQDHVVQTLFRRCAA